MVEANNKFMAKAMLTFLSAEEGGRIKAPQSGFHPQIDLGHVQTSCVVESLEGETVFGFEREHLVSLKLIFDKQYSWLPTVGDLVRLFEGDKLIGTGRVIDPSG